MNLNFIHKYASPVYFYAFACRLSPWLAAIAVLLFVAGLIGGLVLAPADYQQGESFRIIYVHVPAAWMSLFIYMVMATSGAMGLIWHVKIGDMIARACAPGCHRGSPDRGARGRDPGAGRHG